MVINQDWFERNGFTGYIFISLIGTPPISPLHLPYISPTSPHLLISLIDTSPTSPYISPHRHLAGLGGRRHVPPQVPLQPLHSLALHHEPAQAQQALEAAADAGGSAVRQRGQGRLALHRVWPHLPARLPAHRGPPGALLLDQPVHDHLLLRPAGNPNPNPNPHPNPNPNPNPKPNPYLNPY